jgi:hypothetical protein
MGHNACNLVICNRTKLAMPRAKGKANCKVNTLIQVVDEKLLNGTQGSIEVAALYQHCWESVLLDLGDLKWHWVEKCCNKFKPYWQPRRSQEGYGP